MMKSSLLMIRHWPGLQDYETCWKAMQDFTNARSKDTSDELWLLEHPPVFTQGRAGKSEHLLSTKDIPIIQTDRGGQVTYHGPGQLVVYTLFNVERLRLSARDFVRTLEQVVVEYLSTFDITAGTCENAPGIYVDSSKICSIGLRIRKGYSYHGIAFNIDMDLTPFTYINPCGYQGLKMTQLSDLANQASITSSREEIIPCFLKYFRYNQHLILHEDSDYEQALRPK